MMCLADETQVLVGDFLCVSIVLSSKKVPSDDTRFALSLPLCGPLPFTCHGRQAVRKAHFFSLMGLKSEQKCLINNYKKT